MGKLEPIDNKRTEWQGLWFHHENNSFTSCTFDLSDLRKFKGKVRLVVRKNRYYNNGINGRPNYVFMICDSKNEKYNLLSVVDEDNEDDDEGGLYVP